MGDYSTKQQQAYRLNRAGTVFRSWRKSYCSLPTQISVHLFAFHLPDNIGHYAEDF